jgi:riboflavin synthase
LIELVHFTLEMKNKKLSCLANYRFAKSKKSLLKLKASGQITRVAGAGFAQGPTIKKSV